MESSRILHLQRWWGVALSAKGIGQLSGIVRCDKLSEPKADTPKGALVVELSGRRNMNQRSGIRHRVHAQGLGSGRQWAGSGPHWTGSWRAP